MNNLVFICLWTFILFSGRAAASDDAVGKEWLHYVAAIESIKSYDVTLEAKVLGYTNVGTTNYIGSPPMVVKQGQNRDAFAINAGRRFERDIDKETARCVRVIDWETAKAQGKPLARVLSADRGTAYLEYLNPVFNEAFLSDVLRDKRSHIRSLDPPPTAPGLKGFVLTHPLSTDTLRFWIDPDRGFMLKTAEWIRKIVNKDELRQRIEIDDYIYTENGTWLPRKATLLDFASVGGLPSMPYEGCSIELRNESSSFNALNGDQFLSMPVVNHQENGWKYFYPPVLLEAVKEDTALGRKIEARIVAEGRTKRIVLIAAVLIPLFVLYLGLRNRLRPTSVSIGSEHFNVKT